MTADFKRTKKILGYKMMISQVDTIKYRGVLVAKNLLSGDQEILMKQKHLSRFIKKHSTV